MFVTPPERLRVLGRTMRLIGVFDAEAYILGMIYEDARNRRYLIGYSPEDMWWELSPVWKNRAHTLSGKPRRYALITAWADSDPWSNGDFRAIEEDTQ